MTGAPPPGHLDLDALADVLAGEHTGEPVAAHLSGCADCQGRLAALTAAEERVVAALADLPEPALPDGFDARLAQALQAAERDSPSTTPSQQTAPPTGTTARRPTVVPLRRRRDGRAWLPAAAASLVLVLGGALGWAALGGSPGGEDAMTSAAGGAESADSSGTGEGSDESASRASSAADSAGAGTTSLAQAPLPRSATGVDYADPAQRASALPQVLSATPEDAALEQDAPDPAGPPASGDALARLREPDALAACLSAVAGDAPPPLALDEGVFQGAPALAVVLPSPDPDEVVVHVVGPDCAAGDADTLLVTPVPRA